MHRTKRQINAWKRLSKSFKKKLKNEQKYGKKEKIPFLPRKLYLNFYSSEWWQSLRDRKLKEQSWCEICGTENYLQVHHIGYDTFYKGLPSEALKDTCVLCQECHEAVHTEQKRRGLTTKATKSIIETLQKEFMTHRHYFSEAKELDNFIRNI